MNHKLRLSAMTTLVACGVLAAIGKSEPKASYLDPDISMAQRIIRMMHDRNLNKNATEEELAGYYEGLLAGKPVNLLGKADESEQWRFRGDFLYYEAKPNLDIADYNEDTGLRHVTNSYGMPDVEYSVERSPRTRRVAILGDSITRGKGTPFGENFEALLEHYLNEQQTGVGIDKFELLNFSDNGYRLTQFVDVALEKVPRFKPDAYLVCLTQLSVNRRWGDHIAQLVWDGIDLKYPYLRELAAVAALDRRDIRTTMDAKLAIQHLPAIKWAMSTMQAHARRTGAEIIAVLVPAASSTDTQAAVFAGPREILRELGIPTIDLLDTFKVVDDFRIFKVIDGDVHPNREGHRLIFENLKQRIESDSLIAGLLLGKPDRTGTVGSH